MFQKNFTSVDGWLLHPTKSDLVVLFRKNGTRAMIVQRATAVASEPTRFLDSVDVKNSESTECVRTREINMNMNRLTTVF